jgi:hypothetical protein
MSLDQSLHRSGEADIDCEHNIKFTVGASHPSLFFRQRKRDPAEVSLAPIINFPPSRRGLLLVIHYPWPPPRVHSTGPTATQAAHPPCVSRTFTQSGGPHIPPRWPLTLSRAITETPPRVDC